MRQRQLIFGSSLLTLIFLFSFHSAYSYAPVDSTQLDPQLHFDLNACSARQYLGTNMDYTEFTAVSTENEFCTSLSVVGDYLYRINPQENKHSCTPGINGTPAMCVTPHTGCQYNPGNEQSVRFDILVEPGPGGTGGISHLSFYEQAPDSYDWISGPSGPADNPTLYAVRVLVDGNEIFRQEDIPTSMIWSHQEFDFSGLSAFTVNDNTVFNFELSAYCLAGNGAQFSVWDLDDIIIKGQCEEVDGGTISTTDPTIICAGDSIPDPINVVLSGNLGLNSAWVITDVDGNILALPAGPPFDLEGAGAGVCLIWHISYIGNLQGLDVGLNTTDLIGCYGLSNEITVTRLTGNDCEDDCEAEGGTLEGGPFEFCVGDGLVDMIDSSGIVLSGNSGSTTQWLVTDDQGNILGLPPHFTAVDFDGAGAGTCLVRHLSFMDTIVGLGVGSNIAHIEGCFSISNSVEVIRSLADGGMLTGGPFEFCVGDSFPDLIDSTEIELTLNSGAHSQWVVTDDQGNILGLPPHFSVVDFNGAGAGTCLIWHLSYYDTLSGLDAGSNIENIEGCHSFSNSLEVIRSQPEGGILEGGPFGFCAGDGIADIIDSTQILLTGNSGTNSQWIVTDLQGNILGLPPHFSAVDFDGAGAGTCLIWHISFDGTLAGAELGNNASELEGCFSISNSIEVNRTQTEGGTLEGGPFAFCVGDDVADMIDSTEIVLSGQSNDNSQWVITDDQGNILGLPPHFSDVDFDGAGAGTCLIWHISYEGSLNGAELGNNASELEGCFSISNSIEVNRTQTEGGTLEGGPFAFCVGDDVADMIDSTEIVLSGQSNDNSQWVITDDQGNILGLPPHFSVVDFDGAGVGTCLVWHLTYADSLAGLEVGNNTSSLLGCHSFSNSLEVVRSQPEGGALVGGPFSFCVGDGNADTIDSSELSLTGNIGNSQWVVTDNQGNILGLPPHFSAVDFDGAGAGVCIIWHIAYSGTLEGAELGNNTNTDLSGCYSLSNPVTIIRSQPEGGTLAGGPFLFCAGDGMPDMIGQNDISLTGNMGPNSQWVVTDEQGNILGVPPHFSSVDFDGAGAGTCLVWHISSYGIVENLEEGNNTSSLGGCFSLSNSVQVKRITAVGGTLEGGPFEFCVGNGDPDMIGIDEIDLNGNQGTDSYWVVTDEEGNILGLPPHFSDVDFDGAGEGTCLVWHLSTNGPVEELEVENNIDDILGCYNFSNPISVVRISPQGGTLDGGPFEFCVSDNMPSLIDSTDLILSGNSGSISQWIVTDSQGNILALPFDITTVDFDVAGPGTCLVWHLSYEGLLGGLFTGNNVDSLDGCFSLSNSVEVVRLSGSDCENAPLGELVINEINPDGTVELKNTSNLSLDISSHWLCQFPMYSIISSLPTVCGGDYILEPQELVTLQTGFSISAADGEIAIYNNQSFTSSTAIVDYVEWGSTGHQRSPVAISAGIWTSGDFVPAFSPNMVIEYDGMGDSSSDWSEDLATPCMENSLRPGAGEELDYVLYPNPANNYLIVDVLSSKGSNAEFILMDNFGQIIKQKYIDLNESNVIRIELNDLMDGVYLLNILTDKEMKVKRFSKFN